MRIIDWIAVLPAFIGALILYHGRFVKIYDFRSQSKSRGKQKYDPHYKFVKDRYSVLIGLIFIGIAILLTNLSWPGA